MKTNTKIVIAIVVVLLITIAIGLFGIKTIFNITNKTKDKIVADEFYSKMQEKGFVITDATKQYSEYDYIKQVYIAVPNDLKYQIEFYELVDDNYAIQFFETNKAIFEASKGKSNAQNSLNLKNANKYILKSNGKYNIISRIDNTAIFASENTKYAEEINNIIKELGY